MKKTILKTISFLKNRFFFGIFNPQNFEGRENCSKTPLNVCPLKCTYIGKNRFNLISVWSEIMSLKSDRLELGLSNHESYERLTSSCVMSLFCLI